MKMNKKKGLIVGALALTLATTGIFAYFTDTETKTNTFTAGNVNIALTEPGWNESNAQNITPNKVMAKDPTVQNIGVNDAYVFVEVTVPTANVVVASADGTKGTAQSTELFKYTVNSGWVEVGAPTVTTNATKHTYAYGTSTLMTKLTAQDKTPAVFNNVTFVNLVEGQTLPSPLEVNVVAKAIQTENVNGGKTAPADILSVLNKQGPTNVK